MAALEKETTLIIASWVLGGIVIVITIARVLGRTLIFKQAGWDDVFMVLGSLSAIACSALVTVGISYGLGEAGTDIDGYDATDLSEAAKYGILAPCLHLFSSTCSKISILIFLVRLIGMSAKRWHIVFLWVLGVTLTAINILTTVVTICYCDPPQKQWKPSVPGTCLPKSLLLYICTIQGIYSALTNIIVAVSPALFITQLNIATKMKFGLSLLMGGGVFAAGAAIAKTYFITDANLQANTFLYWTTISLWYTAEMDVLIIAGTIPTLWPLVRIVRRWRHKSTDGDVYNGGKSLSSDQGPSKPLGTATRALEEVDNMPTYGTWNGDHV